MDDLIQKKGLILWIPEHPDVNAIETALHHEIIFLRASNCVPNKDEIILLLSEAIRDFKAYPNRVLRFFIHKDCGCPADVDMSWANPARPITGFMYCYNGGDE
jgi:hypothetical protein